MTSVLDSVQLVLLIYVLWTIGINWGMYND